MPAYVHDYYACWRGAGRWIRLGRTTGEFIAGRPSLGTNLAGFRLSGRYVTFVQRTSERYPLNTYPMIVEQVELRRGRRTFAVTYPGAYHIPNLGLDVRGTAALAVAPNGNAAWVLESCEPLPRCDEVVSRLVVHVHAGMKTIVTYSCHSGLCGGQISNLLITDQVVDWVHTDQMQHEFIGS